MNATDLARYRAEVRKTFQSFSDEALRFQDSIIVGGIDREECNREIRRRMDLADAGGITLEGLDLGHRYVQGNVNAYCSKCSEEQGVCVLDCDYDLDK